MDVHMRAPHHTGCNGQLLPDRHAQKAHQLLQMPHYIQIPRYLPLYVSSWQVISEWQVLLSPGFCPVPPTVTESTISASGVRLCSFTYRSDATIKNAAPSCIKHVFPAVSIAPSGKSGGSLLRIVHLCDP